MRSGGGSKKASESESLQGCVTKTMEAMDTSEAPLPQAPPVENKGKGKAKASAGAGAAELGKADMWVEKYRPATLDDLVAHEDIVGVLNKLIDSNRLPHLLFYGPPGTGKTSTILACARRLYGKSFASMVLELNASDDRGIDVVRNQVKEFAGTRRLFSSGVKLVVLDEADAMTADAQFALRRVIEKYTRHTRFCMICNYVNRVIPALQSRCTRFRFAPLQHGQVVGRLQHVVEQEGVPLTEDGRQALLDLGQGDMRRVLNLLQATFMAYGEVTKQNVYLTSGHPLEEDMDLIYQKLNNEDLKPTYDCILHMMSSKGYALTDILHDVGILVAATEYPPEVMCQLLIALSDIEHRLASGATERLQLGALAGAFQAARRAMMQEQSSSGS